ncbi:MAG TPA: Ig-like domain-containing protein [Gemmatimonadaceae bacterium]|nr:Ig-like domain-containing protein [Gemmatimonadaceae bacterium]
MSRGALSGARVSRARRGVVVALFTAAAVAACKNDVVSVPAAQKVGKISLLSGNLQTGRVADAAPNQLSVEVHDTRGVPMAGVEITFAPSGGSVSGLGDNLAVSDSEGVASVTFTYGLTEGDYTIKATAAGAADTVVFSEHANPGPAMAVEELTGAGQSAAAGSVLSTPLTVEIVDLFGNPIAGATVTWSVTGGGTLSSPTSITDENGKASVTLTLGATTGDETVTAHVDNVPDAVFVETAK